MNLPTPEAIRAAVGESFAPSETYGVAALVLQVDGVRREAWSDETELSEALFESYPRGQVPTPELEETSHKIIDDAGKIETRRCSTCVIKPGFAPCAVCVGTGSGSGKDAGDRCFACEGEGFVKCSICDGTTRVVACTIRYVNDKPIHVRRVLMPALDASIRPYIEAKIIADATWPDDRAFDPEPSLVASAYRGASTVRSTADFHGFAFGDAIALCLQARSDATTGLARFVVRTYAVPILWALTRHHHSAFFYDETGALQMVG
jgi:hypothetical protein